MPQVKRAPEPQVVLNVGTQQPAASAVPAAAPAEKPPEKTPLEANWFFDKITAIPPEQWAKDYTLELLRLEPKIPGVPGSKGFLDVFTEPITKAFIKSKYGGGKFRLVLIKNNRYVTSHDLDIEGDPIYARGREIPPSDSGGSGLESRLLNMLESNLREMKEELRQREARGGDPAFAKAVDILSTAYNTGLQTVQKDQANPTQLLKELIVTAKEMGMMGNGDGNIVATIRVLKDLGLVGAPAAAAAANPLEQLKTFLEIFDRIDEFRGGGSNGKGKDWKATLADRVGDALPTILNNISTPRRGVRPGAAPPAPRPSVSANPSGPQPAAVGVPVRSVSRVPVPPAASLRVVSTEADPGAASAGDGREIPANPGPSETAASAASVDNTSVDNTPEMDEQAAIFVKRRIVECVRRGEDGALVVDFLEIAWPAAVNYLEAFAPEQVTEFFSGDAILIEATQNKNWPRVLREAQEYLLEETPAEPVTH